jgi:hypothetical protein
LFRDTDISLIAPIEIPSEDEIIAAAQSVLESTPEWKEGKAFHKNSVQTYSRPKLQGRKSSHEAGWHCRVSTHPPEEATFDQFWSKLGENKAENEQKLVAFQPRFTLLLIEICRYIPEIKKVTLIKQISPNMSIWSLYYNFGIIVSPRVFTVLQVKRFSEENLRKAFVPLFLCVVPFLIIGLGLSLRYQ